MNNINWQALIAGLVTLGSVGSVAIGQPALGALIADPHTAQALTGILGGAAAIWSMFSPALLHSTTIAKAQEVQAKQ